MSLNSRELDRIKDELKMITGVVVDDLDYLVYLLLKDGAYFNEEKRDIYESKEIICKEISVPDLDSWFKNIKEGL